MAEKEKDWRDYLQVNPTTTITINGIIYGEEGTGKSTLASSDPQAVLVDCGRSARFLKTRRMDASGWDISTHLRFLDAFLKSPEGNLHYDETTTLIKQIEDHIIIETEGNLKKDINNIGRGFGEGGRKVQKFLRNEFFARWREIQEQHGSNILLYCHAEERPSGEETTQKEFRLRMTQKYAQTLMEWADLIGHLKLKEEKYMENGVTKTRVHQQRLLQLHQTERATAKNRFGITEEISDPTWKAIMERLQ